MAVKDYYSILKISPSANQQEIKKAFRQLALQFHPDKTEGDTEGQLRFEEIREAYEILSDPGKKERYLQDRWIQKAFNQPLKRATLPENTLLNLIDLKKRVRNIDDFRGGYDSLAASWQKILDEDALQQLKKWNDPEFNQQIVSLSIDILSPLSSKLKWACFHPILSWPQLDPVLRKEINSTIQHSIQEELYAKWKVPALLFLVALICLGIFFLNK